MNRPLLRAIGRATWEGLQAAALIYAAGLVWQRLRGGAR